MGVYDQINAAFQDLIAPELHMIRGEIRVLDQKVDSLKAEMLAEFRRVDTRIDAVNERIDGVNGRIDGVNTRIDSLEREVRTAVDIRERLAALEARRG